MASRVEIDGHPTWVEDRGGAGAPLLLLHGGLSNSDELLNSIGAGLSGDYRVVAFDRRGHGYTADTDAAFHYEDMATETIRVLEQVVGGPAHLVGWSDGGIIALLVALRRPDLVHKLVVIGANYHYDGVMPVELDPRSRRSCRNWARPTSNGPPTAPGTWKSPSARVWRCSVRSRRLPPPISPR